MVGSGFSSGSSKRGGLCPSSPAAFHPAPQEQIHSEYPLYFLHQGHGGRKRHHPALQKPGINRLSVEWQLGIQDCVCACERVMYVHGLNAMYITVSQIAAPGPLEISFVDWNQHFRKKGNRKTKVHTCTMD